MKSIHRMCTCFFLSAIIILSGCSTPVSTAATLSSATSENEASSLRLQPDYTSLLTQRLADEKTKHSINSDFLEWACHAIDVSFAQRLYTYLDTAPYSDSVFYTLFQKTFTVLYDEYTGAADFQHNIHLMPNSSPQPILAFTGDVNLADDWEIMPVLKKNDYEIEKCLSHDLLSIMQEADVLLVNNEFCFSPNGSPMPKKQYTFRAQPQNVKYLQQMGVDIVSLANNHVYDYGTAAFHDTLQTLKEAEIPYVGAGKDLDEAMLPQYFVAGGIKIGFVAASRAEKFILTPEATEDMPGILRTYDDALFLESVREAKQNADFVIAYPHWGTENSTKLEDAQTALARALVDAGADAVVGAHPHCLQGIEFYKDKPIVYSLGNFWFNTSRADTALLLLKLNSPDDISVQILPCLQSGGKTTLLTKPADKERIFSHLQNISPHPGVAITKEGFLSSVAQ